MGSPEQRAAIFAALKKFYGVRSKIMHTGTFDSTKTFRISATFQLTLEQLADRCIFPCAAVLERIASLGDIPDLASFDITEKPVDSP